MIKWVVPSTIKYYGRTSGQKLMAGTKDGVSAIRCIFKYNYIL